MDKNRDEIGLSVKGKPAYSDNRLGLVFQITEKMCIRDSYQGTPVKSRPCAAAGGCPFYPVLP